MTDVHLKHINYTHIKVIADPSILMELSEHFSWFAPNYKWHPRFKSKQWDGKISLVNRMTGYVYAGLSKRIKKFCDERDYSFSFDDELLYDKSSIADIEFFIKLLNLPSKFETRDYQLQSIHKCIQSNRRTLLSPTSSGKSMMIYILSRWYSEHKCLIIVPTAGLVSQFESDIRDYGFDGKIITSIGGLSKSNKIDADIVITTWQSLSNGRSKMNSDWYEQFGVVFGDEAHGCSAKILGEILSSLKNCKYRFGTTGTLDDNPLNEATIEGLFGPRYKSISTREMIDSGYASNITIKCIVLKYPESICKEFRSKKSDKPAELYHQEIDFLVNCEARNKFIKNLALSLKGNKLIFFKKIEHGIIIKNLLKDHTNVFHIDGSISAKDREIIRNTIENEDNCTLVGSLGTTSTGTNIKRITHMIGGSPSKSKIKVLQSIGRMLRQHEDKKDTGAFLYDIVDDLSVGSYSNYVLKHFIERIEIYDKENFDYQIYNVELKV